jgi:hypothetical protein
MKMKFAAVLVVAMASLYSSAPAADGDAPADDLDKPAAKKDLDKPAKKDDDQTAARKKAEELIAQATKAAQEAFKKGPHTLADVDADTRKKLTAMLDDAKKEAREKIKSGVEKALEKRPKISQEMAALLRSSSTQETWLKLIVDGAFKANSFLLIEQQYQSSCEAIRRMHDHYSGLEGDAFIEDYVTKSIEESQPKKADDKTAEKTNRRPRYKHENDNGMNTNGLIQAGGN